MTDLAQQNLLRAGELFMHSVWLQGQLSDLIILGGNPNFVADFVSSPVKVPAPYQEERIKYWQKDFYEVKEEFKTRFSASLLAQDIDDLESVYYIRNAIAHSHFSFGRDYLLYRPSGGQAKEQKIISALGLKPVTGQSDPLVLKLTFWKDEQYELSFNVVKRLDEICLERISNQVGIPHSRIR